MLGTALGVRDEAVIETGFLPAKSIHSGLGEEEAGSEGKTSHVIMKHAKPCEKMLRKNNKNVAFQW